MKTIKVLIQRVQSLYSKGVQSDDSRLRPRHIYSILQSVRATLLKRKSSSRDHFSDWEKQVIHCVELIKAEAHECPCVPPKGCTILRSKYKIPKPLSVKGKDTIESVSTITGSILFSKTSWEEKKYKSGNKYTSGTPDYYIRGEYLYLTSQTFLKVIAISGVFEDPIQVQSFIGLCKEDCIDCEDCIAYQDLLFPINSDLESPLIALTLQELSIFFQSKEDISNDVLDSPNQDSK